jgi:hypothetical protein
MQQRYGNSNRGPHRSTADSVPHGDRTRDRLRGADDACDRFTRTDREPGANRNG